MLHYVELRPTPAVAGRVECFWTLTSDAPAVHRVVPDGCADILLTISDSRVTLDAVGPMTGYRDYEVAPGSLTFGARFRPGQWPFDQIPDAVLPLDDLWGSRARALLDRLAHTPGAAERARLLESALPPGTSGPVERAISWLERSFGQASLDHLASEANLSPRQFRRLCVEKTGYTPKLLARILRFRRATQLLATGQPAAEVALDCGYYDQPHLINEFRTLAGRSPAVFSASSSASSAPPR